MTFSDDGSLFAYCDGTSVQILSGSTFTPLLTIPRNRTAGLQFSPRNTILATWEPFLGNQPTTEKPQENLELWDARTGLLVKSFVQKKQFEWSPQWTKDEKVCSRNVNNEIVFYEDNKFDSVKHKLHMAKVTNYMLAERDTEPYYVAVHMPGAKGQPSSVRLFQYPNFGGLPSALGSKSFYKAETASLVWNSKGTSLLILTATESSSASYYGEQGLHYVDVKGESCLVPRAKDGPVYSATWSPQGTEFCVVYGCMPAKATLYNLKCEPVFDFGTGPRNLAYYNPHGTVLCLAGFGNLRGNMELWDVSSNPRRLISNPQAIDSTQFEWCPDGQHFMTATTTPRLRIGNGYKIWHISGTCLYASPTWPDELYEAIWQPRPDGFYPAPSVQTVAAATKAAVTSQQQQAKPKAYVPPALRDQPQPVNKPRYREAFEPDSNTKQLLTEHKEPSKSAIKNKKKREAKARRKQDEQQSAPGDAALSQQLKGASLED
jgi:translation initiation factor 2A